MIRKERLLAKNTFSSRIEFSVKLGRHAIPNTVTGYGSSVEEASQIINITTQIYYLRFLYTSRKKSPISFRKMQFKQKEMNNSSTTTTARRNINCRLIDDISLKGIMSPGHNETCYKDFEDYVNNISSSTTPPLSQVYKSLYVYF